jgi:anti-repressor protein
MNELIKIEEKEGKQTVNARELWYFLESKQDFSDWIKKRIDKYGFIENSDYIKLHKKMELSKQRLIVL